MKSITEGKAKEASVKLSKHRLRKGFGCRVAQQLGRGNAPVLPTVQIWGPLLSECVEAMRKASTSLDASRIV